MLKFTLSAVLLLSLCGQLFAGPLDRFRERRAARQGKCCQSSVVGKPVQFQPVAQPSRVVQASHFTRPLSVLGNCAGGRCAIPVK